MPFENSATWSGEIAVTMTDVFRYLRRALFGGPPPHKARMLEAQAETMASEARSLNADLRRLGREADPFDALMRNLRCAAGKKSEPDRRH